MNGKRVCVTGAAGFIGGHLCKYLSHRGFFVRGIDYVSPRYGPVVADEFSWNMDLRQYSKARRAVDDMDWVFNLAADMGGAGFVFTGQNDRDILRNNALINLNMLEAARETGVRDYLFSSSACVYPEYLQLGDNSAPLKEEHAIPADPDSAYGWEKLYAEQLCAAYNASSDMNVKVARFHNCYGPAGAWTGGREKAPAAMCRKVATATITGDPHVEIWGDGTQMRSYMFIADCCEGLLRLMESDYVHPLNMGRSRCVTVDELVDIVAFIAGFKVIKKHIPGPTGVAWRNSDNTKCREVLGWEPTTPLEEGLVPTYMWIKERVREAIL
jgi:GDP-D-mannose 3',5'-epimerase